VHTLIFGIFQKFKKVFNNANISTTITKIVKKEENKTSIEHSSSHDLPATQQYREHRAHYHHSRWARGPQDQKYQQKGHHTRRYGDVNQQIYLRQPLQLCCMQVYRGIDLRKDYLHRNCTKLWIFRTHYINPFPSPLKTHQTLHKIHCVKYISWLSESFSWF